MGFSFDFHGTDVKVVQIFASKNAELMKALTAKMYGYMEELQRRAQAVAPVGPDPSEFDEVEHVPGTLRASIRDPEATQSGEKILGTLTWGGEPTTVSYKGGLAWDYARIIDQGSRSHAVNPLEARGSRFPAAKTASGKSERRFGSGVLAFMVGGKDVFAEYAFSGGITPNKFVEDTLQNMKGEIIQGLQETIFGVVKRK